MKIHKIIFIISFVLSTYLLPVNNVFADARTFSETDTVQSELISFFDLRDRESFVQVTNTSNESVTLHIQIFNVNENCNENNFYDVYTPNDTHLYNLRDILSNDSNPSGVVLPQDAYGIFSVVTVDGIGGNIIPESVLIGNLRIIDNNGYEYRTNSQSILLNQAFVTATYTFNFNNESGVILSDVVAIMINSDFGGESGYEPEKILRVFTTFDVDILNNNETIFSCRDVIFACVDQDNPLKEELLEIGNASVASFEYGINNGIPHSKGGELLCPGNNISNGIVILTPEVVPVEENFPFFFGYIGLNNGNSRGSFDSIWVDNREF